MKKIHNRLSGMLMSCVFLLAFLLSGIAPAAASQPESLPLQVFKNLQAGKHQTVVVYGTSVSIHGEWANALRDYFDAAFPGQVTFLNNAQSGKHSNWGVENLQERVLDVQPDLVFLEFAINDAATKHHLSPDDCAANLDTLVKAIRAQNPQVDIVLQTMDPAWDSPASAPKKYASDRPRIEDYYAVYRRYAHDHELPLVDHYPVWNKILQEEPERYHAMVPDGIHPGKEASLEVAWPAIKMLLEKARKTAATIAVWPAGKRPGQSASEPEAERPSTDGVQRLTPISEPTLTLFPARGRAGPAPAMIVCPGGGYRYVTYNKEGTEIAEWLNSIGISALVLKYRVPDNREGALQDIQRALSLVRARAADWNIDPNRLGVIGFSAGGNLCAKTSNGLDARAYAAIDDVDQQSCRPDFAVLVYPAYLEKDGVIAKDLNVTAEVPPTLILHTDDDQRFIAGSRIYAAALADAKVPHQFICYPTGGHGYGLHSKGEAQAWPEDAGQWLRKIGVPKSVQVVIIGDSTVSLYQDTEVKRGWGQMIPPFFDDTVGVDDRAVSGCSTKTFIEQGRWEKTLDVLHPNDYVLIQFGHNDSHDPSRKESTAAFGDYQTYLQKYIDETRAMGAIPILVTPMHRRSFDENGKMLSCRITETGEMDGDLEPYARAMKQVALSNQVSCIDLFTLSGEYMQRIGDEACIDLLAPGDRTHWNGKGATVMASLVIQGLAGTDEALKDHIRQDK